MQQVKLLTEPLYVGAFIMTEGEETTKFRGSFSHRCGEAHLIFK